MKTNCSIYTSLIAFFLLSVLIATPSISFAQDITGQWNSLLKVPGASLRLLIHITESEDGSFSSKMDSPDQNSYGIPTTSTTFKDGTLNFEIASMALEYSGEFNTDTETIEGTFKQGGQSFPLNFNRKEIKKEKPNRPQEPLEPFSYYTEEVKFPNEQADITLAGTLSLPKIDGDFPVVILISGSGAQDRNEEILGHKPFLVLADHLTRMGIGVLRYDDRGFGESTGDFAAATTEDFAADVESAIAYLKSRTDINPNNIGLIGHSEGGIIAPMVATKDNSNVAFMVLLAAPAVSGAEILLLQQQVISQVSGVPQDVIANQQRMNKGLFDIIVDSPNMSNKVLFNNLVSYLKENLTEDEYPSGVSKEIFLANQINPLINPWFRFFLGYDPLIALKNLDTPVFALNGSKDLQVDANQNLSLIEKSLNKAGNKQLKAKLYADLNHLFQESKSGLVTEYGTIEQTISPLVLADISEWINSLDQ
jgi:pimeloyl-ACP methyl ester carboxylesterase